MGQVGLHGLTGLLVSEQLLNRFGADDLTRRALVWSFVMGNMVPDLDFISVIALYPINGELAVHMHRGFTHSILAALVIAIGMAAASWIMKDSYVRYLGFGMALGVVSHFTADIFMWFSPVDLFWPASAYGYIPPINLWWWFSAPPLIGRLWGAAELLAFALYYEALLRLARRYRTNGLVISMVRRMAMANWSAWAMLTAFAFEASDRWFTLFFYPFMAIVAMPSCLYITWRMQETIEGLAVRN